ncbi:MAG: trypsin-like peptidase domain-containing protein [Eubacteriales bacterium]|nr:trypsin-like peptidase domain-containing protein [Eubacteriales bacterium]
MMKKVLAVILSAVLFGAIAGGTMVGINTLSGALVQGSADTGIKGSTQDQAAADDQKEKDPDDRDDADDNEVQAQVLDVSDIVEETMPQVVSITNTMLIQQQGYGSIFDYFYGGGQPQQYEAQAAGSGVIVKKTDDELLIVTNNHVVENAEQISVTFDDGETVDAAIKGTDSTIDLAIVAVPLSSIKAETMDDIKVATLHDSEDLKIGQGVIAIGNALGFGQSVTVGYISALNREITTEEGTNSDLIQVDAAINPGNSGGALINMNGEVIGINVAKLADTSVEGVGYAIPIYKAMDVIDNLSNAKTKVEIPEDQQGRLGVYIKTINEQYAEALNMPEGVLVAGFADEDGQTSAAKDAGILQNDIITKFDGQSVSSAEDLTRLVKYYEAGSTVKVTVQRLENGQYVEKTIEVTLGSNPDAAGNGNAQNGTPDGNAVPGQQPGNNGSASPQGPDGNNGQDNGAQKGQNGQSGTDDLYEKFREFLEQYQR